MSIQLFDFVKKLVAGSLDNSERVNLGLIGRGWIMGSRHVPLFLGQVPHGSSGDPQHPMDDVRVLAVCDVDTNSDTMSTLATTSRAI
jgi:predicted dehydrogenase